MKKLNLSVAIILIIATTSAFTQDKGDLIYIETEHVSPQNTEEYMTWAKAYKQLADETEGPDFFVSSELGSTSYIMNIGTEYSGIQEFMTKRSDWMKANPKAGEMYDQYSHTVDYITRSMWRHSPKYSYMPEGASTSEEPDSYTRLFSGYIRQGQNAAAGELLDEYKQLWTEHGFEIPYGIYFNIFGEEQTCLLVVQGFKDKATWLKLDKIVIEKIGADKLAEMDKKWNQILRKMETREATPHPELSHINN